MSFPGRSSADSSVPRSFWWRWTNPDGVAFLFQSAWPAVVLRFQRAAKAILTAGRQNFYAFDSTGACFRGNALEQVPAVLNGNVRRVDAITADGVWGPETRDVLGQLLCLTGQTSQSRELAANPSVLPRELVRQVIWFSQYVSPSDIFGSDGEPKSSIPEKVLALGSGIALPEDLELPQTTFRLLRPLPALPAGDREWIGLSPWGGPFPRAPSEGGGINPWPADLGNAMGGSGGSNTAVWLLGAGAAIYLFSTRRKRR